MLYSLGFISIVMGTFHEPSLQGGKNLPFFMFLYVLGDYLRCLESKKKICSTQKIFIIYIVLNASLMLCYYLTSNNSIGKLIWLLGYPYCSPLLVLNAVFLFLLFSRMDYKSKAINWLSGSVFAVYIIHHQDFILNHVIKTMVFRLFDFNNNPSFLIPILLILTIMILFCCIIIDKMVSFLWGKFASSIRK